MFTTMQTERRLVLGNPNSSTSNRPTGQQQQHSLVRMDPGEGRWIAAQPEKACQINKKLDKKKMAGEQKKSTEHTGREQRERKRRYGIEIKQ